MSLPVPTITPIPTNDPQATPELWNERYAEIDENFENLDDRAVSVEDEILQARFGKSKLDGIIGAIIDQIGGIPGPLDGTASPRTLQDVFNADLLYRSNRQEVFELFTSGFSLQNLTDVAVINGVSGDDSLDIADTSNIITSEDYLLTDDTGTVIIRPISVLSATRIKLSATLDRAWDSTAKITGRTLIPNAQGGADAVIGSQWISKKINLGNDAAKRVITVRRTANTGVVRLYFRDSYTTSWTEVTRSIRKTGGGTTGIPSGYYDDKYLVPMVEDGYLRIVTETAAMTIKHITGMSLSSFSVSDFIGDDGSLAAFQAAIDVTPNSGIKYIHVPDGSYSEDLSTLTFGSRKVVWREDSNVVYTGTAPLGVRNPSLNFTCDSVKDFHGMAGLVPGQQIHVASYYKYSAIVAKPRGGGYLYMTLTKLNLSTMVLTYFLLPFLGMELSNIKCIPY